MKSPWPAPAVHPTLSPQELHVWAVSLCATAQEIEGFANSLSGRERERCNQYLGLDLRRRFTVARGALRTLVGRYLAVRPADIELTTDVRGKPYISAPANDPPLHFNVTHSGELALLAFSLGQPIGIDIERIRTVDRAEQIARRYFHPLEIEAIETAGPELRDAEFMHCWTCKEAVLKAVGTGITDSLAEFAVSTPDVGPRGNYVVLSAPGSTQQTRCWFRALTVDPEFAAAVAVVGDARHVQCLSFG